MKWRESWIVYWAKQLEYISEEHEVAFKKLEYFNDTLLEKHIGKNKLEKLDIFIYYNVFYKVLQNQDAFKSQFAIHI